MIESTSVQIHVLKLIDLITRLGQLDFHMDGEFSQDLILQSLPDSSKFVINYHMNKLDTSLPKLLNMLKVAETHIKGEKGTVFLMNKKKTDKKGSKRKLNPKSSTFKKKKAKDVTYFLKEICPTS